MITFLNNISRTKPFSPSKLYLLEKCKLSYLLQTENIGYKVPSGPYSFLGTAIHKTIEQILFSRNSFGSEVKKLFLENLSKSLEKSRESSKILLWVLDKVGVDHIFDNTRIIGAVQQINKTLSKFSLQIVIEQKANIEKKEVMRNKLGSEVTFDLKALDISGNIDLCFLDANNVIHVIDFKSGRIFNDEGNLKDEYLFQIGLYGLMVSDHFPNNEILLEILSASDSWTLPFEINFKQMLVKLIEKFQSQIPLNINFSLDSLAQVGNHCSTCRARNACPKYFEILNNTVTFDNKNMILSKEDFYGEVIEVNSSIDIVNIKLISVDKNIVSISGIPKDMLINTNIGETLVCYSLKFYDHESLCKFPANFYVYRPDIPKLSAFESVILT